ncbi:MAG TPA: hypothetical protein VLI72_13125 [Methylibium sp.]|nr:hypothetical protein [Methylibium sp.]
MDEGIDRSRVCRVGQQAASFREPAATTGSAVIARFCGTRRLEDDAVAVGGPRWADSLGALPAGALAARVRSSCPDLRQGRARGPALP